MSYKSNIEKANRISEALEFPNVVLLDNTSACNLKCAMCDHVNIKNYRKIEKMPMELYKKIIDEITIENSKARIWEIFFGDPFLCNDMPERILYAKEKGCEDVVLNTNGVLMTADKAESYIKSGLDVIYVGIDAAQPETYNKIRVGGDYNKAVENVLAYQDLLNKYGQERQKIFVQYVVSEENENEVEAFRKFWNENGVNVKIRPKISWAGLVEANNLNTSPAITRKPCFWLMQTINICADGRVALCSVDLHCRVACGNVKERSIKDLWQNGSLKDYRRMHLSGTFDLLPVMCKNCFDWQSAYADYQLVE